MRDRVGFEHQTATVGEQFELVEQARLPQPRLAHHPHDLPMPRFGLLKRLLQLLQLSLASDKPRQAPAGRDLQLGAQAAPRPALRRH